MSVVWRLAAATTLIVLAFAMAAPVLAVSLQQAGYSTAAVGAFAMIPFLLIAVLIPIVPRVLARWGIVRAYRWGCFLQLAGAWVMRRAMACRCGRRPRSRAAQARRHCGMPPKRCWPAKRHRSVAAG